ncbi:AAA family ATPase [Sphingopyxis sp. MSC1_008]|uniref:AAA family ATPase n=1 Tax=Sphingopyxis sp. MSC1_008 TaxID=2909265 RepID=UPI0020BD5FAC
MQFTVIPYGERSQARRLSGQDEAYLVCDNWDDYGFKTSFALVYFDFDGDRHEIGEVKLMRTGMRSGFTDVPGTFQTLGPDYASLGQDQGYYETLLELAEPTRVEILVALRDAVWDSAIRGQVAEESAWEDSLTRSIGESRLEKFIAILHQHATLTEFDFTYEFASSNAQIAFTVTPGSLPPSNIHVVIGRNGVGKTTLLNAISWLIRNGRKKSLGRLRFGGDPDAVAKDQFANLVTVAFSAFDSFDPPTRSSSGPTRSLKAGTRSGVAYTYVGLKKRIRVNDERATGNKSEADLQKDFITGTLQCLRSASRPRWQAAMRILEADPLFAALGPSQLADLDGEELEERAAALFETASSGHKIVLLTLTRLAELVSERTLVLIDEPEAHLHPPLVMAFVRALSDLLANRNGVAILATHSPVVVQEVPASCVSLMFRPGDVISVERPEMETFAENLGALTREIFRLEVTESGHHALIAAAVADAGDIDEVLDAFGDQVGAEGRALARAMLRAAN